MDKGFSYYANRVVTGLEKALVVISAIALVVMFLVICYNIFGRQFGYPTIWATEFSGYLLLYITFLAAPWILANDDHVKVDLFTANLQGKKLRINNLIVYSVTFVAFLAFFWYSFNVTLDSFQNGTKMMNTVQWPQYILLAPITVGSFALLLRLLMNIIKIITGKDLDNTPNK